MDDKTWVILEINPQEVSPASCRGLFDELLHGSGIQRLIHAGTMYVPAPTPADSQWEWWRRWLMVVRARTRLRLGMRTSVRYPSTWETAVQWAIVAEPVEEFDGEASDNGVHYEDEFLPDWFWMDGKRYRRIGLIRHDPKGCPDISWIERGDVVYRRGVYRPCLEN